MEEVFSSRAFRRLFAQRELYSKFSPFHARFLVSHSLVLLTLVVAHARELIVMNFVEYTFLLCLRYVLTTLRSPPLFADKSMIKRRSPSTILCEILISD